MAISPLISLQGRGVDVGGAISSALINAQRVQQIGQSSAEQPFRNQLLEVKAGEARDAQRFASVAQAADLLLPSLGRAIETGDTTEVQTFLQGRITDLENRQAAGEDVDPVESVAALTQLLNEGPQSLFNTATGVVSTATRMGLFSPVGGAAGVKGASQREFESKLSGLTEEQKQEAILIDLGINSRAVGSGAITIAKEDLTDLVANSQAVIKQRGKFAEMTGASRATTIDKGFARINGINKNINNIDRAISALDSGAGTGPAEQFFPSIRAASKTLEQIQGELALDVVGAVTFGALSKGELDLAKEIALPTGLDEPELRDFLIRKKTAQTKLRDYFNSQIQFLDQGGTVAGFLRQLEREAEQSAADQPQQVLQSPSGQQAGGITFLGFE